MKSYVVQHPHRADRVIRAETQEAAISEYARHFGLSKPQQKRIQAYERVIPAALSEALEQADAITTVEE